MISRRDFAQLSAATAALLPGNWTRALAQQRLTQAELLRFEPVGNVTIVHVADIHGMLVPIHYREPSINVGVVPFVLMVDEPLSEFEINRKSLPPPIVGGAFVENQIFKGPPEIELIRFVAATAFVGTVI